MSNEIQKTEDKPEDPFDVEPVKVPSSTAEEFLQKLDLADDRWGTDEIWIFRGQTDATWKLEPHLFRDWDKHKPLPPEYEIALIDNFVHNINRAGLPIPANSLSYRRYTKNNAILTKRALLDKPDSGYGREYDFTHVVFALAQHSGVPTRLLDFTYDPLVAAFFAVDYISLAADLKLSDVGTGLSDSRKAAYLDRCIESIDDRETLESIMSDYVSELTNAVAMLPKDLAVWAIRVRDLRSTSLRLLAHSYNEIQNLRLQKGVFLCETENYELQGKPWRSFNGELSKLIATGGIYKLTLPFSQKSELIDNLYRKKITRPVLKPTYETIAKRAVDITKKMFAS